MSFAAIIAVSISISSPSDYRFIENFWPNRYFCGCGIGTNAQHNCSMRLEDVMFLNEAYRERAMVCKTGDGEYITTRPVIDLGLMADNSYGSTTNGSLTGIYDPKFNISALGDNMFFGPPSMDDLQDRIDGFCSDDFCIEDAVYETGSDFKINGTNTFLAIVKDGKLRPESGKMYYLEQIYPFDKEHFPATPSPIEKHYQNISIKSGVGKYANSNVPDDMTCAFDHTRGVVSYNDNGGAVPVGVGTHTYTYTWKDGEGESHSEQRTQSYYSSYTQVTDDYTTTNRYEHQSLQPTYYKSIESQNHLIDVVLQNSYNQWDVDVTGTIRHVGSSKYHEKNSINLLTGTGIIRAYDSDIAFASTNGTSFANDSIDAWVVIRGRFKEEIYIYGFSNPTGETTTVYREGYFVSAKKVESFGSVDAPNGVIKFDATPLNCGIMQAWNHFGLDDFVRDYPSELPPVSSDGKTAHRENKPLVIWDDNGCNYTINRKTSSITVNDCHMIVRFSPVFHARVVDE